jgi:hypothetical protein
LKIALGRIRWARHEALMKKIRNVFTMVIGKHEEMRIVGSQKVI